MQENEGDKIIPVADLNPEDPLLSGLRITKVVCSRSIKMSAGEVYVGFSASVDQAQGISIRQGRVAALRIGMEVDRLAYQRAVLGRIVDADLAKGLLSEIVQDYVVAIKNEVCPPRSAGSAAKQEDSNG